jgi:hypothetical protein
MRLQLIALVAGALGLAATAHADEVTGTWTGDVELRGSYYWETSTRVIAPAVRIELEAPSATTIRAGYLIDTITSASQAFGAVVDRRFTELRHDLDVGVSQEIALEREGDSLTIGGTARTSYEDDYQAYGFGANAALSLDDDATVLRTAMSFLHDDVSLMLRGGNRVGPDGRDLSDRGEVGELDGVVLGVAWDQVLSPVLTSTLSYDFAHLWGYQANPYRMVPVGAAPQTETHPQERTRHTFAGRLALYIPDTHTAVHGLLRVYTDDWDINAVTPEVRLYQEIGPSTQLRLRYRFYGQTSAFFAPPPDGSYADDAQFFTADPKMTRFHSHLLGVQGILRLDTFAGSSLDFASRIELELGFDYIWSTSRYGDAVTAQVAMRVPF